MKKILNKISGIILIMVAAIAWCIYSYGQTGASMQASSSAVKNTKIGWGVKRNENHNQPDLRKDKCRVNGKV